MLISFFISMKEIFIKSYFKKEEFILGHCSEYNHLWQKHHNNRRQLVMWLKEPGNEWSCPPCLLLFIQSLPSPQSAAAHS